MLMPTCGASLAMYASAAAGFGAMLAPTGTNHWLLSALAGRMVLLWYMKLMGVSSSFCNFGSWSERFMAVLARAGVEVAGTLTCVVPFCSAASVSAKSAAVLSR